MVWDYRESRNNFYSSVERHNRESEVYTSAQEPVDACAEEEPPCAPKPVCPSEQDCGRNEHDCCNKNHDRCHNEHVCRRNCPNCRTYKSSALPLGNILTDILNDKDKLLIVGLMLVLIKEKSSIYVIAALAYVLLG